MREKKGEKHSCRLMCQVARAPFACFYSFFSTPSGVFIKLCVSKLSFCTTLFIPFISFYRAKRFFYFILFHHTQHRICHIHSNYQIYSNLFPICMICNDLWDVICEMWCVLFVLSILKWHRSRCKMTYLCSVNRICPSSHL